MHLPAVRAAVALSVSAHPPDGCRRRHAAWAAGRSISGPPHRIFALSLLIRACCSGMLPQVAVLLIANAAALRSSSFAQERGGLQFPRRIAGAVPRILATKPAQDLTACRNASSLPVRAPRCGSSENLPPCVQALWLCGSVACGRAAGGAEHCLTASWPERDRDVRLQCSRCCHLGQSVTQLVRVGEQKKAARITWWQHDSTTQAA